MASTPGTPNGLIRERAVTTLAFVPIGMGSFWLVTPILGWLFGGAEYVAGGLSGMLVFAAVQAAPGIVALSTRHRIAHRTTRRRVMVMLLGVLALVICGALTIFFGSIATGSEDGQTSLVLIWPLFAALVATPVLLAVSLAGTGASKR